MSAPQNIEVIRTRRAVIRPFAETYIFISLTAYAVTVVATRFFLALTGYPQLGTAVLHFAHALWGGLLLFAGGLLILIVANQTALTLAAVLNGVGAGLFIDEIGKFITHQNDYFFAPAAPIIYSLFLLLVLLYLMVRRSRQNSPRAAMYRALAGMGEILDHDLDPHEREQLLSELAIGQTAAEPHIAHLANRLASYLQDEPLPLAAYRPSPWARLSERVHDAGARLGRKNHYHVIQAATAALCLNAFLPPVLLTWIRLAPAGEEPWLAALLLNPAELAFKHPAWFIARLSLGVAVGALYLAALFLQLSGREAEGVNAAILAALLSLTAVRLMTFYLNQFSSLAGLFANLALFLVMLAYREWYLLGGTKNQQQI